MRQEWTVARWRGIPINITPMWLALIGLFSLATSWEIQRAIPEVGNFGFLVGLGFIVAIYLTILIHEFSHALMARRYGLKVHSITLNFLGGATRIEGDAPTPRQEFWLAAVGPITSLGIAAALWLVAQPFEPWFFVHLALMILAGVNAFLGVLNLIPGIPFDGGHMLKAVLWARFKNRERATMSAARAGQVFGIALVVLGVSGVFSRNIGLVIVGVFVFYAASATRRFGGVRRLLNELSVGQFLRPAVSVPESMPLAQALGRADVVAGAGLVTLDASGAVRGVVSQAAVNAVPQARRPFVELHSVARTLAPELCLEASLSGAALLKRLQEQPAPEYVVVDAGRITGVVLISDVNRAFQQASKRK